MKHLESPLDICSQIIAAEDFTPKSAQQKMKLAIGGADYILLWRYALSVSDLPQWLLRDLDALGYELRRIGSTTYRSSTWAITSRY